MEIEKIIKQKINEYIHFMETINAPGREFLYNNYEIANIVGKIKMMLDKIMVTDFTINTIDFIESKKIVLDVEVLNLSRGIYKKQLIKNLY